MIQLQQQRGNRATTALVQRQRRLPSGANIFQLEIYPDFLDTAYDKLWASYSRLGSFSNHPTLPKAIRQAISGSYFRGSTYWTSGKVDNGVWLLDTATVGLTDFDVEASATLYYSNPQIIKKGTGTYKSGGSATDQRQTTTQTQVGGSAKVSNPVDGGGTDELSGSASSTTTGQTTYTSGGTNSLTMKLPTNAVKADVHMRLTLRFHWWNGVTTKSTTTGCVGQIVMSKVEGT